MKESIQLDMHKTLDYMQPPRSCQRKEEDSDGNLVGMKLCRKSG